MNIKHCLKIAEELILQPGQVEAAAALLNEGATVPFIARYRKEATDSLDEVAVTAIRNRIKQLEELDKRREAILKSLDERELLTEELKEKIDAAGTLAVLEDIYLPFRPKRRTRATAAREKGLEPLAEILFEQGDIDPFKEAEAFLNEEKGVLTTDDALAGARDIIAEWVNENENVRFRMRKLFYSQGIIESRVMPGKEEDGIKFRDYYECKEPIRGIKSHRLLAIFRGEKELFLLVDIRPPEENGHELLEKIFIKAGNPAAEQVKMAVHDGYCRLLAPSMETETRVEIKKKADEEAISVFADNLRQLLLAPPLGQKNVIAVDPGFRTGCKLVCLNRQSTPVHYDTIFPHSSEKSRNDAAEKIIELCRKCKTEVIAVGNGTAGRETETFIRNLDFSRNVPVIMVNESGASIYSASEAAREEFPEQDVSIRGAISIGRRLMDPLAELVKIDPKSIGVGQYQHDVDQNLLRQSLDDVVVSCVNSVGVELNTASKHLLSYISGIGPKLAEKIVTYRHENGSFNSRNVLKKVPGLGQKAFEQAAGFLRINGAENPLDSSAVHPESYHIVETMADDLGRSVVDLIADNTLRRKIEIAHYITEKAGLPTLNDIMDELARPGRDPRDKFEMVEFAEGIGSIEDLRPGMLIPGVVTNVTRFGAFVDIGVHQDGLVHISQIADKFVKNPMNEVKVTQKVMVTVLEVDLIRRRISLSMKKQPQTSA